MLLAELEALNKIQMKKQNDTKAANEKAIAPAAALPHHNPPASQAVSNGHQRKGLEEKKPQSDAIAGNGRHTDPARGGKAEEPVRKGPKEKEKDPAKEKEKLAFKWGARDVKPRNNLEVEVAAKKSKPKRAHPDPTSGPPSNGKLSIQPPTPSHPPLQPRQNNLMAPESIPPPQSVLQYDNGPRSLAGRVGAGGGYLQGFQSKNDQKKGGNSNKGDRRGRDADRDDGSYYSEAASAYSNRQTDARSDHGIPYQQKGLAAAGETSSLPALLSSRHSLLPQGLDDRDPVDLTQYDSPKKLAHPLDRQSRRVDNRASRNTTMSAPPRLREDGQGDRAGYTPAAPSLPSIIAAKPIKNRK